MISVALIGPDGAGKSTISRLLETAALPAPVKSIYMGVNLEASGLMLPTTRLLLMLKRARGGRADMTASSGHVLSARRGGRGAAGTLRGALQAVRLLVWLAEEWFRQLVAKSYLARGKIVVFDRHFFADYYHYDVAAGTSERPLAARLHGYVLRHLYPKPDLVVCLDAPGEVLYRRKQEASPVWLEERRKQYKALGSVLPNFAVVDVDRPVDVVTRDVAGLITQFYERRSM